MNNISSLVSDSLEFYDANTEKYEEFFKNVVYYTLNIEEESSILMQRHVILFYDKNKKVLHKSRYEMLGIFDPPSNIWVWAWAVPYLPKTATHISRKILNYGAELDPENEFLKTELITSRFRISDPVQIELHTGIASYLSKQPIVVRISPEKLVDGFFEFKIQEKPIDQIYYLFITDLPLI